MGYPWGKDSCYDEATLVGDGPRGFARASLAAGVGQPLINRLQKNAGMSFSLK